MGVLKVVKGSLLHLAEAFLFPKLSTRRHQTTLGSLEHRQMSMAAKETKSRLILDLDFRVSKP